MPTQQSDGPHKGFQVSNNIKTEPNFFFFFFVLLVFRVVVGGGGAKDVGGPLSDQHIIFTSPGTTRVTMAMARCLSSTIVRSLFLPHRVSKGAYHMTRRTYIYIYNNMYPVYGCSVYVLTIFLFLSVIFILFFPAAINAHRKQHVYRRRTVRQNCCDDHLLPTLLFLYVCCVYNIIQTGTPRGVKQTRHCGTFILYTRGGRLPARWVFSYKKYYSFFVHYYIILWYGQVKRVGKNARRPAQLTPLIKIDFFMDRDPPTPSLAA